MYTVAEKFLLKNDLPSTYIDQIVKFLETNTQASTIGSQNASDPFTGGSSYRSVGSESTPADTRYQDPFTGGGAYISGPQGSSSMNASNASGKDASLPQRKSFRAMRTPQYFSVINPDAVKKKLEEFSDASVSQEVMLNGGVHSLPPHTES
jgi:phospholipase A-2-activating protein